MELRLAEREEGGTVRREREIVRWVARLGAVSVGQIGSRFGVGRSVAYELVRRVVAAGLLERTRALVGDPTLISATAAGIAYAGLGLPTASIRIGEVDHWLACADVAIELERRHGPERVLTDRELRFEEQLTGKPTASAKLGETRNGYWRLHYPDLAVVDGDCTTVYEVELTPKSRRRLETIIRAWRRARHVERCVYLCAASPTQQAVEGAIRRVRAAERVRVVELRREIP
jgi:DNA-binding MarR family transcriptional regulator